jgi:hypothetical protein
MITAIPADQAEAFAILRRPQVPTDLLPERRWMPYGRGLFGRLGLNPALARRTRTPLGNVWVIPGESSMCLSRAKSSDGASLDGGGMTANTTQNALEGRVITWTASRSGSGQMVQGLAPDTIAEVELLAADGSRTTAQVSDNAYGADLGAALVAVLIGGETVLSLGVPER